MRIRNTDRNYMCIVQYKRDEYVNEDDGWHQDQENKIQPHRLSAFFNPKQKGFFFEKFCKSMLNNRLTVLAFIKTKNNSQNSLKYIFFKSHTISGQDKNLTFLLLSHLTFNVFLVLVGVASMKDSRRLDAEWFGYHFLFYCGSGSKFYYIK